eukprot:CAMPEP_0113613992 /NCGR_PEP_ID=MMETSP0017_2-20120614/6931_1 /TAXON_ID=2856 /ORGANISM="Cylindrotheca closterium" /LENGTH=210 /DNA_ID=CAMNT_0000523135 /DNA_START=92 /DNA_END=724 /DNA_ORIENTATION=- /assembly_acc=CAM_ASM_000147
MASRKEANEELQDFCGCDSRLATIIGNGLLSLVSFLLLVAGGIEILHSRSADTTNSAEMDLAFAYCIMGAWAVQLFLYGMAIVGAYSYRSGMVRISLRLLIVGLTFQFGFALLQLISSFNTTPLLICLLKAYILWFPMTDFIKECDTLKNRNNSELLPIKHLDDDDEENGIFGELLPCRGSDYDIVEEYEIVEEEDNEMVQESTTRYVPL